MPSLSTPARGFRSFVPFALTAAVAVPGATLGAQLRVAPGLTARTITLPRPARGWANLDLLPSGDLVGFEGSKLVILDAKTGAEKTVLARIPPVFGTDVRVGPTGTTVFFGESTLGGIFAYDLTNKATRKIATVSGSFDFRFHPREGERFLWMTADPGFRGVCRVLRLDTATGALDKIIAVPGFAGPFVIDPSGNLYLAPAPRNLQKKRRILRWTAAQVRSAIGPRELSEKDATVFATGIDSALDMTLDEDGVVYVADVTKGTSSLLELGVAGGSRFARNVVRDASLFVTHVFRHSGAHPFERYGRPGTSLVVHLTNFKSIDQVAFVTPERPVLTVAPTKTPRAGTSIQYLARRLPPSVAALWLFGAGLQPERPLFAIGARGQRFPDFGIVLSAPFLAVAGQSNSTGISLRKVRTPNVAGIRWTTQVVAGPVPALPGGAAPPPLVTSAPLVVQTK